MTIAPIDDSTSTPETEALIEEARSRQRHRRITVGAALLVLAVAGSVYGAFFAGGSGRPPSANQVGDGVPLAVGSAIERTLAVRSIEVIGPPSKVRGPGIYQAPNLYAAVALAPALKLRAMVIYADTEYFAEAVGPSGSGLVKLSVVGTSSVLRDEGGLSPAQQTAFFALIQARSGTDYRRVGNEYTFRLASKLGRIGRFTGGKITIAHGYVTSVTTDLTILKEGNRLNRSVDVPTSSTYRYLRIDANPRVAVPQRGLTMCIPPGSGVLSKSC